MSDLRVRAEVVRLLGLALIIAVRFSACSDISAEEKLSRLLVAEAREVAGRYFIYTATSDPVNEALLEVVDDVEKRYLLHLQKFIVLSGGKHEEIKGWRRLDPDLSDIFEVGVTRADHILMGEGDRVLLSRFVGDFNAEELKLELLKGYFGIEEKLEAVELLRPCDVVDYKLIKEVLGTQYSKRQISFVFILQDYNNFYCSNNHIIKYIDSISDSKDYTSYVILPAYFSVHDLDTFRERLNVRVPLLTAGEELQSELEELNSVSFNIPVNFCLIVDRELNLLEQGYFFRNCSFLQRFVGR